MSTSAVAPFIELAKTLHGRVVLPEHPDYDVERILWNQLFDRHPSAIAKCTGAVDIIKTLEFARENGLDFTVCSGRHDPIGKSMLDETLVIDTGPMQTLHLDPVRKRVVVGAGCRWEIVDRECQHFGLAVTGGTNSDTGVAGLTLGGGIGHLMRKLGATVDSLVGLTAVTVDGEIIRVNDEENPELFWGMRGAGANFAIATSFEFKLQDIGPTVLAGPWMIPAERAAEALKIWRDYFEDAPRELSAMVLMLRPPAADPFPEELWRKPLLNMNMIYAGDLEDGEKVLAPLRKMLKPVVDLVGPTPYVKVQKGTPQELEIAAKTAIMPTWRPQFYEKGGYLASLEDEFIDKGIAAFEASPIASEGTGTPIFAMMRMGGAIAELPEDSMAFSRNGEYWWDVAAMWENPADNEAFIAWCRDTYPVLEPYAVEEGYINLSVREDIDYLKGVYGRGKFDRLRALKKQWDPDNLLHHNRNIPPAD